MEHSGNMVVTLADRSRDRSNHFDLVRLICATIILWSHSYPITSGRQHLNPSYEAFGFSIGSVAVNTFFLMAGYLLMGSYLRTRDVGAFVRARLVRILPGWWVAMLVLTFGFGLALSARAALEFLSDPSTYAYLARNAIPLSFWLGYDLPGVFESNAFPQTVNGSFWTLPWELWLYVSLIAVGILGWLRHRRVVLAFAVGALVIHLLEQRFGWLAGTRVRHLVRFVAFFWLGGAAHLWSDRIRLDGRYFAIASLIPLALARTPFLYAAVSIILPYQLMWFAHAPLGAFGRLGVLGRYSYGMYLYGFAIQQCIVAVLPGIRPLELFAACLPLTLAAGALSTHLIENPATERWRRRSSATRSSEAKRQIVDAGELPAQPPHEAEAAAVVAAAVTASDAEASTTRREEPEFELSANE
jgi:peptidoglycan/LPS O-acetylase OafA/YrhL